jgi:prepilin-type N-terminal cleavage/methylation domain-containing protein
MPSQLSLARRPARSGRRVSPARAGRAGMTLVELMIVVVVIAIMAGAFAPSVRRTVLEQRAAAAAREFVRILRDARLRTTTLRRAHLVYIDPTNANVRLLRGSNNSCLMPTWTTVNTACTNDVIGLANGNVCTQVNFSQAPWSMAGTWNIELAELPLSGGSSAVARSICFAPNGTVYHAAGALDASPLSATNDVSGGFLYELRMVRPGLTAAESGLVPRQILVPLSGMARLVR